MAPDARLIFTLLRWLAILTPPTLVLWWNMRGDVSGDPFAFLQLVSLVALLVVSLMAWGLLIAVIEYYRKRAIGEDKNREG